MTSSPKVRTCLWFERHGAEAARFYVSLLPDSWIESQPSDDSSRPAMIVNFILAGAPYQILNGGPTYRLTPAASISVVADDQAETDRLWNALTQDGGEPSRCGWLKDRFGLSWQIVPRRLPELLSSGDSGQAGRVMQALMKMSRIDIAALEEAVGLNGEA